MEFPMRRGAANRLIPTILWLLPLTVGVLIWIARGPLHAPPFKDLTAFQCDPNPVTVGLWIRGQNLSPNIYACRNGDQLIYQRTPIPIAGHGRAWVDCSETVTIWRPAVPNRYSNFVFQSACGNQILASYDFESGSYDMRQVSGRIVAILLVVLGVCGLGSQFIQKAWRQRPLA